MTKVKQLNAISMKNPRGYFLNRLFMIALLLFALGSIQGNPRGGDVTSHNTIFMNSPPEQIVTAIIENPNFQVSFLNDRPADILIFRGISVPYPGLIINYDESGSLKNTQIVSTGDVAFNLGLRSASISTLLNIDANCNLKQMPINRLRGVNTRLDIGEGVSDPAGIRKT
jgi:hypothetical protein